MCIVLLAYKIHPQFPLIVLTNRDEFYDRESQPSGFWEDYPYLLAGKDIEGKGTWLGITKCGRFAVITNYRDPHRMKKDAPTRGFIALDYLVGSQETPDYLDRLGQMESVHNGFNLIFGNIEHLHYYSNIKNRASKLNPGIYGLSNHFLDTPWPKVKKGKRLLEDILEKDPSINFKKLLDILFDDQKAKPYDLPETGIGSEFEHLLSSIFIKSETYGTKASTVIRVDREKNVFFNELSFQSADDPGTERQFNFRIS